MSMRTYTYIRMLDRKTNGCSSRFETIRGKASHAEAKKQITSVLITYPPFHFPNKHNTQIQYF